MQKAKNLLFRLKLRGNGIVNYDSSEQRFMFNGTDLNHMKTMHNNTSYAKKKFYKEGDSTTYKISISSDCLRHELFSEDVKFQSPNIINQEHLLYSFIASPASLLRGYLFADTKETLKRKGPLTITNAEQTCNAISHIETFSRSGLKIEKGEDSGKDTKSDNSFFKKEVVGNIEYQSLGTIDLMQLQFVSCDQVFDRYSFNPDMFNIYKTFLKTKFPSFDSELGYYQINGSSIEIPEYGFKLNNDNVLSLVRLMMAKLLTLNVRRKNAFVETAELEYKVVYDVFEDTFSNEDGWVTLKNASDISAINFDVQDFYVEEDKALAVQKREAITADFEKRKSEAKEKEVGRKADVKEKNKAKKLVENVE
jgi:hypothetical protein